MKQLRRKIAILALAWSALFLIAAESLQEFGSLNDVLVWVVVGGGAAILSGYVLAYLLENFAWWHNLPSWVKRLVPLALAGVFGFVAQAVLDLQLLSGVPPGVQALILTLINWLFNQRAYAGVKDTSYASSAKPRRI